MKIKSVNTYLGPVIRNGAYKCDETVKIDDTKLGSIYFLSNCL